jgi:hypothetical protein
MAPEALGMHRLFSLGQEISPNEITAALNLSAILKQSIFYTSLVLIVRICIYYATMLLAEMFQIRFRMLLQFSINLILPILIMALGTTQLTEMSTRNHPGGKVRPALKADNHTAICEPIV